MQPDVLISLAAQIPFVAAFIWFVLKLMAEFRAAAKEQQAELQMFIADQNKKWQDTLKEHAVAMTEHLRVERDRRREAMDQGLREVQLLATSIDKIHHTVVAQTEAIGRHDAAATERHRHLMGLLEKMCSK